MMVWVLLGLLVIFSFCDGLPATNGVMSPDADIFTTNNGVEMGLFLESGDEFRVVPRTHPGAPFDTNEVAVGMYNDSIATIGWGSLYIKSNERFANSVQMRAAGYLEGYLTAPRIYTHAVNTGAVNPQPSPKLSAFLSANQKWMKDQITSNHNSSYWHHVDLVLTQLRGMYDGYKAAASSGQDSLTYSSILFINLGGDIEDLGAVLSGDDALMADPFARRGKCSAAIRLTNNNADILVTQTTWSSLESMTRIYKMLDIPLRTTADGLSAPVPARRVAFSSYPGSLYSGDDFYVLSSALVVQETTIGNSSPALYKEFITPESVLEWIRNIIANRLAESGDSWAAIFTENNSGTYNNQNMIVDLSRFVPGQALVEGTFTLSEQVPGTVVSQDLSEKLQTDRYFGSYNIAYDPIIRDISGVDLNEKEKGSWFSYEKHPRAKIFARDMPNVENIDQLKKLIRYNDYKNDPLSTQLDSCAHVGMTNCTPAYTAENAISCRSDLNPSDGVYAFSALGHRDHVATDAKLTAFSIFNNVTLPSWAISGNGDGTPLLTENREIYLEACGPTCSTRKERAPAPKVVCGQRYTVPAFQFSSSEFSHVSHEGLPDRWEFPWVAFEW